MSQDKKLTTNAGPVALNRNVMTAGPPRPLDRPHWR